MVHVFWTVVEKDVVDGQTFAEGQMGFFPVEEYERLIFLQDAFCEKGSSESG